MQSSEPLVNVMKALADSTRLDILRLIASAEEYPCTSLEANLSISKSTISYHAKVLRAAGLISVRREGKFYFYTFLEGTFEGLSKRLLSDLRPLGDDRATPPKFAGAVR